MAAVLILAGCASGESGLSPTQIAVRNNPDLLRSTAPADTPTPPSLIPLPPPSPPPLIPIPADSCGALPLRELIGQPRTAIPAPIDPSKRRVYCSTCPVTQDERPDRQNIIFDGETGLITDVTCG